MPPRKRMKQIKVEDPEPALDNAQELQQQASAVVVAVQQQALAARVLGEDQARVMEEELVQAKVQLAELNALLQSKELQLAELRAEIRRLQLTHPPPPPSSGVLELSRLLPAQTPSSASPITHRFFHSTAKETARLPLCRTMDCPSLLLSFRLLLLLLLLLLRLSLMTITTTSTLVTAIAMMTTTQLHGHVAARGYLRAVAW